MESIAMMTADPNEPRSVAMGKLADLSYEQAANVLGPALPTSVSAATVPTAQAANSIRSINLPKIIPFAELCRCGDEIWIEHDRQIYRLRKTKQGKLILTK
jgi:hemin uptake protein HemP